jgi:exosome complex component RRP41
MPIGYMPNLEKITLLQLDGVLSPEEFKKCVETGIAGCKIVYELQKKALTEKYFQNGGDQ